MKKLVRAIALGLTFFMFSCGSNQTTYEIKDFIYEMNPMETIEIISFQEEERIVDLYVIAYLELGEEETIYFAPRKTYRDNIQYFNDSDFFKKIGQEYVYIILVDNQEPEPDEVRYPDYEEIVKIFEPYINEEIDTQE